MRGLAAVLAVAAALAAAATAPAAEPLRSGRGFSYDVPVLAGSPWPEMRRDVRNTGESQIRGRLPRRAAVVVRDRPRDLLDPGDR